MAKKILQGKVVSNKMQKTIVVDVESIKFNPKYKRYYKSNKKYKAHAENSGELEVGRKVQIQESAPLSRGKKWIVINK